jgi:tetratricopeptide (TPR) repeat protein
VTTQAQRGARAELDAARPAAARLDATRGSEDLAADLIDMWSAVEAAVRSLVGSSALTGQALIREARQRQMISFDLANALAEFEAVRGRVEDTAYRPGEPDIAAARNAFSKLDAAMLAEPTGPGGPSFTTFDAPRPAPSGAGTQGMPASGPVSNTGYTASSAAPLTGEPVLVVGSPAARKKRTLMLAGIGALVVILVAGGGYMIFGRKGTSSSLQQGIDAYRTGQREIAVSAFTKASREDPKAPLPHIYLARMAREVGNFTLATQELETALTADPNDPLALREMGANMLAKGDNELARRFYVRAVQADPTDKTAQGYLGCALVRLNRASEGTTFLNRAGPGPWTNCTAPTSAAAPTSIPR